MSALQHCWEEKVKRKQTVAGSRNFQGDHCFGFRMRGFFHFVRQEEGNVVSFSKSFEREQCDYLLQMLLLLKNTLTLLYTLLYRTKQT